MPTPETEAVTAAFAHLRDAHDALVTQLGGDAYVSVTPDDEEEVELGWIRIRKVLATTDSGVDIKVATSDGLAVLDALGMLRLAEHWVMDTDGDE